MQFSSRHNQAFSLLGLCIFLLSLFQIAISAPLPQNSTLITRADDITQKEFIDYLKAKFPNTGNYMFYSAESGDQCSNFAGNNEDQEWHYYETLFDPNSEEYIDYFGKRTGDVADESRAMATVATGNVLVFGAVEYITKGQKSGFKMWEIDILHQRLASGDITAITHMQRDAAKIDDVLATEGSNGKITYKEGQSGPNASGSFSDCSETHEPPKCQQ